MCVWGERYLYSLVVQSVYNHNISLELCFSVDCNLACYFFSNTRLGAAGVSKHSRVDHLPQAIASLWGYMYMWFSITPYVHVKHRRT